MNKITLTEKGKEILSRNTLQGGEVYWVGYFGLAYVPDQSGFKPAQTRLIGSDEHGDYIYNLWQGDLVGDGHTILDESLKKLTLYDRNITSNFRYVYDEEKDRNRLVTWVTGQSDGSTGTDTASYMRDGYRIYNGITMGDSHDTGDLVSESEMPCPAPLFYAGGSVSYSRPLAKGDFVNSVVSNDWPMHTDGATEANAYPMVTPDMRVYGGSWKGGTTGTAWDWVPDAAGKYDTLPSSYTRNDPSTPAEDDGLDQYAKFVSISNFNKEHGHVSSEGYGVGYQESCHNMSMVTRLFPIANYELTATSDPETVDGNITERGSAKSIKYSIRMNLKAAYQAVRAYLDILTYTKTDTAGISEKDLALYSSTTPNSFKFNRIGIYAVRANIRHFYKEGDAANRSDCRATHYQMEISPDACPELFAVMQVDEVGMSEDGSFGFSDYNTTFVLNLESAPENTGLCTNPEVYYNLVENEAITWYQNQLLATAGLSEAVTNLGVNMAYVMNRVGQKSSCGTTEVAQPGTEITQVNSDWNANSGVAQILNKPVVPEIFEVVTGGGAAVRRRAEEVDIYSTTGEVKVGLSSVGYLVPDPGSKKMITTDASGNIEQKPFVPTGSSTLPVFINGDREFEACKVYGYYASYGQISLAGTLILNGTTNEQEWGLLTGAWPYGYSPYSIQYSAVVTAPVAMTVRVYEKLTRYTQPTEGEATYEDIKNLMWVGYVPAGKGSVQWNVFSNSSITNMYLQGFIVTVEPATASSGSLVVNSQAGWYHSLSDGWTLGDTTNKPTPPPWVGPTA